MKIFFTEEFGKAFIPEKIRPYLKSYLLKAGITEEPFSFFGALFYISLFASGLSIIFIIQFIGDTFKESLSPVVYSITIGFTAFFGFFIICLSLIAMIVVVIYFYLDIKIFNRTRKLEEILPDFLSMVSSNLKGGVSFEKALWMSIKPRFGILSNEIGIAAKKVMTGNDVEVALEEIAQKYDSPMLKRALNLIIGEVSSGGKISDIMDDIAQNLKKTRLLKQEMTASVVTYMIFIAAVVIVISPVLYALSYNLLVIIQKVTALLAASLTSSVNSPLSISDVQVDESLFRIFSHIAIAIVAIFSSMIVSIIEKGNIKGGVKYIPLFLLSSQFMYYISFITMEVLFGNFIKF